MAAHTIGTLPAEGPARFTQELRTAICDVTAAVCTRSLGSRLRALVLTGSLARDEATLIRDERNTIAIVGDADFLVVLEPKATHPSRAELCELEEAVERRMSESGIRVHAGLEAVSPDYFDRLPAHSFTYELKNRGRLIWGDPGILDRIPQYHAAALSKEDAWRTLNNRIIEVLMQVQTATFSGERLTLDLEYVVTKLYLDMATSYLILAGRYQPTYQARAMELAALASETGEPGRLPFDRKVFSERVSACTVRKLTGLGFGVSKGFEFLEEAIVFARALWDWEVWRLSWADRGAALKSMIAAMGRRQTYRERLRGWALLLCRAGWRAVEKNWLRWARLFRVATPRYLVYGAAVQLLCEVPRLIRNQDCQMTMDLGPVRALLPMLAPDVAHTGDWRSVVGDVTWCYRNFLWDTFV